MRLLSDGNLDQGFGQAGILQPSLAGGCCDNGFGVAVLSSGDIVVAGAAGSTDMGVAVLTQAGQMDTNFGVGGKAVTPIPAPGKDCFKGAVAVDSSSRIVVGAQCFFGPASVYLRYLGM
jgi:hypothetical protein